MLAIEWVDTEAEGADEKAAVMTLHRIVLATVAAQGEDRMAVQRAVEERVVRLGQV